MSVTRRGVLLYAVGIITGFAVASFSSNYSYMSNATLKMYTGLTEAVLTHEQLDALPGPRDIINFKDKHLHKGKCSGQVQ